MQLPVVKIRISKIRRHGAPHQEFTSQIKKSLCMYIFLRWHNSWLKFQVCEKKSDPSIFNIFPRPPTPPPVVIPEPFAEPEAVIEDIPEAENQPVDEEGWITEELKEYFDIWDLSIRCYELNDTYKYLVPKLKIYKGIFGYNPNM